VSRPCSACSPSGRRSPEWRWSRHRRRGRAAELYAEGRAEAQSFLERGREEAAEERGVPAGAGRAALSGVELLLVGQVLAGETRRLGERSGEVAYVLTVPYLAQGRALREARRKAPRRHLRAVA
jgi:hypothetical protein